MKERQREEAGPPPEAIEEYDLKIPVRDGTELEARVYAPRFSASGPRLASPLFVSFYGGGYCTDSYHDKAQTYRLLAVEADLTVVSVGYRLAPELPFPAYIYDGLDSLT